eukprot:scaffold2026_cov66-Phaeocystis_antarctica.AAC.1
MHNPILDATPALSRANETQEEEMIHWATNGLTRVEHVLNQTETATLTFSQLRTAVPRLVGSHTQSTDDNPRADRRRGVQVDARWKDTQGPKGSPSQRSYRASSLIRAATVHLANSPHRGRAQTIHQAGSHDTLPCGLPHTRRRQ